MHIRLKKTRDEQNKLSALCERFCVGFAESSQVIKIDVAASELHISRRRMYEILNILQSVGLVRRLHTRSYKWEGYPNMIKALEKLKDQIGKDHPDQSLDDTRDTTLSRSSDEEEANEEDQEATKDSSSKKTRKKAVTTCLSEKFIQAFMSEPNQIISLEDVAAEISQYLGSAGQRRLYDIANVFCSLGLIKKAPSELGTTKKRRRYYIWCGPSFDPVVATTTKPSPSKSPTCLLKRHWKKALNTTQMDPTDAQDQVKSTRQPLAPICPNIPSLLPSSLPLAKRKQENPSQTCIEKKKRKSISNMEMEPNFTSTSKNKEIASPSIEEQIKELQDFLIESRKREKLLEDKVDAQDIQIKKLQERLKFNNNKNTNSPFAWNSPIGSLIFSPFGRKMEQRPLHKLPELPFSMEREQSSPMPMSFRLPPTPLNSNVTPNRPPPYCSNSDSTTNSSPDTSSSPSSSFFASWSQGIRSPLGASPYRHGLSLPKTLPLRSTPLRSGHLNGSNSSPCPHYSIFDTLSPLPSLGSSSNLY